MKHTRSRWFKRKQSGNYIEKERKIKIGDSTFNQSFNYANNVISTSKYSIFTFLPKNLFEQFQRIANAYFLCLLILQLIPQISSLTPITTVIPLVCVLSLTALKDGIDDIRRHHNDRIVNNRKSFVLRNGHILEEKWHKVQVGDILKLTNDQFVAADLLLVSSSEPNGLCYIETAELDGETNLKCRQALTETAELEDDLVKMGSLDAEIICEPPNNRLNKFEGVMSWNGKTLPLDNDRVILRGCILRNTKWCYGVVLFAGKDTKLMQNCGKDIFKRTSIDKLVNVLIIGIFIFLLTICLFTALGHGIWQSQMGIYFRVVLPWEKFVPSYVPTGIALISSLTFLSYLILLNTLVPISLYVSIEMIRIAHSFWVNWDIKMFDTTSGISAKARTTTLNEELGQIQYIFSDKTGTLTQNIMCFKKCSIAGQIYGYVPDEKGTFLSPTDRDKCLDLSSNPYYEPKFKFYDKRLLDKVRDDDHDVVLFFKILALCHTIMPGEKNGQLEYLAQSPDEGALVSAARNFGVVFKSRTPSTITIEYRGKECVYQLLAIFDFNNVRKRMSVVVKREGKIVLYSKGADTVIMERLDASDPHAICTETLDHLTRFAIQGLRTLCLAYKEINPATFTEWQKRYNIANSSLENRDGKLDALYEELETGLHLLGATAVEDKLQEGVPETIANLLRAGIRIWVLTGDKQETAINIGYSCQLLNDDVEEIYVIEGQEFDEVERELTCIRKTASMDDPTFRPPIIEQPGVRVANHLSPEISLPPPPSPPSHSGSPFTYFPPPQLGGLEPPTRPSVWDRISGLFRRSGPARPGGDRLTSSAPGSITAANTQYSQWLEWNDRIRRNFYWLIAPPTYNYNTAGSPAAAGTFQGGPGIGGAGSVGGPTSKGLRQPEIESMRIDVRTTPPVSKTNSMSNKGGSDLSVPDRNSNNNNSNHHHNRSRPNIALAGNGRSHTTKVNNSNVTNGLSVLGGNTGRKSPVSPYESRLRYPNKSPLPPSATPSSLDPSAAAAFSFPPAASALPIKHGERDDYRRSVVGALSGSVLDVSDGHVTNAGVPSAPTTGSLVPLFLPQPTSRDDVGGGLTSGSGGKRAANNLNASQYTFLPPVIMSDDDAGKGKDGELSSVQDHQIITNVSQLPFQRPAIYALVISGHSLVHALDPRLEHLFIELGSAAMAVICCRVTPLQKALVVDVVQRHKNVTTLAIGDGANDVSMIKRANIGIGISGLEGRQAVLASDFAIGQFRFLERLLLVHGRWSYYRMAKFLRYFFYKNFAFTLCSFWYGFFCGFSAQSLFDPWFISFYNLFYTSLPVLALAFFEQDVDDEMSLRYPQLYRASLGNKLFNKKIFAQSILHGLITSCVLFVVPYAAFMDGMSSQGKETGLFVFGIVVSTCLIFTVSLQAGIETTYWTGFNHFVIWGSIIFYLAMHFLMYSPLFNRTYVGVMLAATGQPRFWLTVLLVVAILTLPVVAIRLFFCDTRPNLVDRIRYAQRLYRKRRAARAKGSGTAPAQFPAAPSEARYFHPAWVRRSRHSLRTGYAFAHQHGFGDLIIQGTSFRPLHGSFSGPANGTEAVQTSIYDNIKEANSSNTFKSNAKIKDNTGKDTGGGRRRRDRKRHGQQHGPSMGGGDISIIPYPSQLDASSMELSLSKSKLPTTDTHTRSGDELGTGRLSYSRPRNSTTTQGEVPYLPTSVSYPKMPSLVSTKTVSYNPDSNDSQADISKSYPSAGLYYDMTRGSHINSSAIFSGEASVSKLGLSGPRIPKSPSRLLPFPTTRKSGYLEPNASSPTSPGSLPSNNEPGIEVLGYRPLGAKSTKSPNPECFTFSPKTTSNKTQMTTEL